MDTNRTTDHARQFQPLLCRRTQRSVVAWGIATLALVTLSYFLSDRPLALAVMHLPRPISAEWQMITLAGESTGWLIGSALAAIGGWWLAAQRKWKPGDGLARAGLLLFAAVAGSGLLNNLLKVTFARYRPKALHQDGLYGFQFFKAGYVVNSFPSGHCCTAGAAAAVLWIILPRLRWLWVLMALIIAASRVLVRAHYPSDAAAGLYVGVVTALLLHGALRRYGLAPHGSSERHSASSS